MRDNEALLAEIRRWEGTAGLKVLLDFVERERVGGLSYAHAEFARLNAELQDLRAELTRVQRDLNGLSAESAPPKWSLWTFGRS